MHMCYKLFYTTWVRGVTYHKQLFGLKVTAKGASKIFGTTYLFLQPLKPATSNLVYNFGLGVAYQERTFRTKTGGGLG